MISVHGQFVFLATLKYTLLTLSWLYAKITLPTAVTITAAEFMCTDRLYNHRPGRLELRGANTPPENFTATDLVGSYSPASVLLSGATISAAEFTCTYRLYCHEKIVH